MRGEVGKSEKKNIIYATFTLKKGGMSFSVLYIYSLSICYLCTLKAIGKRKELRTAQRNHCSRHAIIAGCTPDKTNSVFVIFRQYGLLGGGIPL